MDYGYKTLNAHRFNKKMMTDWVIVLSRDFCVFNWPEILLNQLYLKNRKC